MEFYSSLQRFFICVCVLSFLGLQKTGAIAEKEVEVLDMASEEDCESNMYVEVAYIGENDDTFTAKLSDIEAINPDLDTEEALAEWQYWIYMNYGF